MLLRENDLEGLSSSIVFSILNKANFSKMLAENPYLSGKLKNINTEHLCIEINETNNTIFSSRVPRPKILAFAVAQSLVLSVLAFVLSKNVFLSKDMLSNEWLRKLQSSIYARKENNLVFMKTKLKLVCCVFDFFKKDIYFFKTYAIFHVSNQPKNCY